MSSDVLKERRLVVNPERGPLFLTLFRILKNMQVIVFNSIFLHF
jgi:hypothetical protein